jgi:hypothetical protein
VVEKGAIVNTGERTATVRLDRFEAVPEVGDKEHGLLEDTGEIRSAGHATGRTTETVTAVMSMSRHPPPGLHRSTATTVTPTANANPINVAATECSRSSSCENGRRLSHGRAEKTPAAIIDTPERRVKPDSPPAPAARTPEAVGVGG